MAIYKHIMYSDASEECYLDLRIPEGKDEFYCFVYFHGGGMVAGGSWEPFHDKLMEMGFAVASTQYRMYPDAKFPDFVVDSANAVAWTMKNIGNYGKCKGVFVGGSSAGGYLSMMLCFDTHFLRDAGVDPMDVAGYLHDAGQPTTHFNILEKERGINRNRVIIDEAAPLYHIGVEKEYPRMMFIVSDNDMENRLEQTNLVISTLRHFRYDMSKVDMRIMHGNHCAYVKELYEDGSSPMANIIAEFILRDTKTRH
ncbi:MAG: alpha/beta hydrolase [Clostridia bacterium]|nr:alpha/beta hydrolase [Clostridia bacterium]